MVFGVPEMLTEREIRLRTRLKDLKSHVSYAQRVPHDPVFFVHRYQEPRDQEIAAVFASTLAYGRVSAFFAVLHPLFDYIDRHGGPHQFVTRFEAEAHRPFLMTLRYRFNTGGDWVLMSQALRGCLEQWQTLAKVFQGDGSKQALETGVGRLREQATEHLGDDLTDLPRGFRYWVPLPSLGSACKRWNLFMRWMVRPSDGVDLGLWTHIDPSQLIIPVDVHLHRVAHFLGLTDRKAADLRTAIQITERLARLEPGDPVGFDFSLCHLGISGQCHGHRVSLVCGACPLDDFCLAPTSTQSP